MLHGSCSNLSDRVSGDAVAPHSPTKLPQMLAIPSIISGYKSDGEAEHERVILAANFLPLVSKRDPITGKWCFMRDEDSLLLQMRDGFPPETEVIHVGSLKEYVDPNEQEEVARDIYRDFQCIPTFLDPNIQNKFYFGFCKQYLWPLFHYMLPFSPKRSTYFEQELYEAYKSANKKFAEEIISAMRSVDDYVWIHDYHLMLVPTLLRNQKSHMKLGFFLHSPFPSSEIYRTLPVRYAILRGLLNADLVGFHTYDYACHFLSCCSRIFGLNHELKHGNIGLDYLGRMVTIKILPAGIHIGRLQSILNCPDTIAKIKEIEEKFKGKRLILGVDDMDIFKGISQKLLGLELLLKGHHDLRGEIVLVQIANPPRGIGNDVKEARDEITSTAERINLTYGSPDYLPIVLLDEGMHYYEKVAYYCVAECCIVNAIRDGMNLVPYEYIVCRQQIGEINGYSACLQTSTLVVSEFVGCSRSLSGAIRVNPYNIDEVSDALAKGMHLPLPEKELHHKKHYQYVSSHDVVYWVKSFAHDLERACRDHWNRSYLNVGSGLKFREIGLPPDFSSLNIYHVVSSYKRTHVRVFFLDYDDTIMPKGSINMAPSEEIISTLKSLCADPENNVFIVSGRGQDSLSEWFSPVNALGIAAEHGYFLRWSKSSEWETGGALGNFGWKEIVEPIMRSYAEATDGSHIETKKTALVWHHQDADPDFGSRQAKELLFHLKNILKNEPVVVTKGHHIVEVKPQGIGKGLAIRKVFSALVDSGNPPDFILCIGDDQSDEDMFECITTTALRQLLPTEPEVFSSTVGLKPTKAKYFVDEPSVVISLLKALATASTQEPANPEHVTFETAPVQDMGES